MLIRLATTLLFALVGLGCAGGEPTDLQQPYSGDYGPQPLPTDVDCRGTAPSYEQVTAFERCVMCHAASKTGAQRGYAPADVNFDTPAAAEANAQRAVVVVMTGIMPPRASGLTLSDAEKQQLYDWAMCTM